jgi:hypothetical protein
MAVDTRQYVEELFKAAGVSDDNVKQAVTNFFTNEAVSKRVADDILRQQDYSRNMDALKTERTKWEEWYAKATQDYEKNARAVADSEARIRAYETAYGQLDGQQPEKQVIAPVQDVITKKDFEAELQKRDAQYISLLKDGITLGTRHLYEFKEPLDTEALAKVAVEKNVTLRQAYDEMVAPRRAELSAAQHKAEIEQAKAEAVRDYASRHHLPADTQPREYHPIFDQDTSKQAEMKDGRLTLQGERQVREGFVEAWNQATTGQTSGT